MTSKGRHIEVFQGANGWYFRVVGANGQKMDASEAYEGRNAKAHAIRAADNLHHPLPIWIMDDVGNSVLLRPEDEVMAGPGPLPDDEPDGPEPPAGG